MSAAATAAQARTNAISATEQKNWATAKAKAALAGFALRRTDPADGPVSYFVEKFGLLRELRGIDDLEALMVTRREP